MGKRSISAVVMLCLISFGLYAVLPAGSIAGFADEQDEVALEARGYLVPVAQVQVTPRVAGQVIELNCEEGARVEKGALLARIDPTPYELDLRRAEALVAAARARFEELREVVERKKDARSERLEALRADLAAAEAAAAKAKWLLDGTQVRAPIAGTILAKFAEIGNTLDLHSPTLKASVCEIADLTRMEVDVAVPDRDIRKLFKVQKCKVRLDASPDKTYTGVVSRVLPVADRAKGTISVRVRIEVPKGDTQVRPEMGAIVSFLGKSA
jgi:RND family efflux transporter MFP subunit